MKPQDRTIAAVSGLVVAMAVGGLGGVALFADRLTASPITGDVSVAPMVVPVKFSQRTSSTMVGVVVETSAADSVAVGRSGTVTQLNVSAGKIISSGDVIATVDDENIVAMVSRAPLFRDLSSGAIGDDVLRMEEYLAGLGFYNGTPTTKFGREASSAVRAFNLAYGYSTRKSVFGLNSVAWIGTSEVSVGAVSAFIGESVAAGSALFTAPIRPVAISVTEGAPGVSAADGGNRLVVGTVSVPYVVGSGRVTDSDSVAELVTALGAGGKGSGQVIAADPVRVMTVPATAVLTDSSGATCVYSDAGSRGVLVKPVGGGVGSVDLPAGTPLAHVLANPSDVLTELTCG